MTNALGTWWMVLTQIGNTMRLSRQVDHIFRYYVLDTLRQEGLFDFLSEPRTYGQILAKFGYVDSAYTRDLLNVLVTDKRHVLAKDGGLYVNHPNQELPQLEQLVDRTSKQVHNFVMMAKGMAHYVSDRLRAQPIEFVDTFEQDGRQLLSRFDRTLGSRIYTKLREAAFTYLGKDDQTWLHGRRVLEVGCGSGRSTAEFWLALDGEVSVTGIDPVPGLIDIANRHFPEYLDEMNPAHPRLTNGNHPSFEQASATSLPYEDESFDAVYCAFVLHWTMDPRRAIGEIARVLKPGGLVFGLQPIKPLANPYFDLIVRTNENCFGFFWKEEFSRWCAEQGIALETATPITIYKGRKGSRPA